MLACFKFHHIGVAVKDIDRTAVVYTDGGYKKSDVVFDPIQNVNICWLTKEGMPTVELLAPVDEQSPVCRILEKNGVTLYHTCYVVEDIDLAVDELRKQKYVLVSKPEKAIAIHDCRVAFLHHRHVGLIELVEAPANIT
jgi:methylmalonyl-CoA/ethylmalonyl-CoA epimerase